MVNVPNVMSEGEKREREKEKEHLIDERAEDD